MEPLITNDAIVLGILIIILAFVFQTAHSDRPFWRKFYKYVPSLLLCYFIPSVLNSLGLFSGEQSKLYFVSSRYLLPTSLVVLTLSIDIKEVIGLGRKAVIMFLTGTFGIIIGGPLTVLLFSYVAPDIIGGTGPEAVWRGLTTVAGSWIGGSANQTAMKEVFEVGDTIFSSMIAVDVIVASLWMAFLLYGAGMADQLDIWLKADSSAIHRLRDNMAEYSASIAKIPSLTDVVTVMAVGFGMTALAHAGAGTIAPWIADVAPGLSRYSLTAPFFWLVVIATTGGLILSFTKARQLEGVGASRYGSLLLYVLIASIGMRMDITAIFRSPELFLIGLVWIIFHVVALIIVAKLINAPFFFVAVGSQANIGGAASAPIVASVFHPSLAPVGVLLAVLGYALGTYGAWLTGILMQAVAP
jgi:uncharacterized membrane protein